MKEIGKIYLIWKAGIGGKRHIVGVIKNNANDGVRFRYIKKNLEKAKEDGFVVYNSFPDLEKEYNVNIVDVFGQRIIRSERHDLVDFYNFWAIDKSKIDDKYYMLAYTQGLLPIDNFEFLAEFYPIKGLVFVSEVVGLSYSKVPSDVLKVGDKLNYKLDSNNKFDSNAVQVFKGNVFIGYIKLIHNRVFHNTDKILDLTVQSIEKNGILKRVFVKIEV